MSGSKLPDTGAAVFDAADQAKDAEVVGSLALAGGREAELDADAIRAEQAASAVALKPVGGASGSAESKALLAEAAALSLGNSDKEEVDLLESEYGDLRELLDEVYARLDAGTAIPESLVYYEEADRHVFGVIDHGAEEFLCVGKEALTSTKLRKVAEALGLDGATFGALIKCWEGREWLLTGEDPTDWAGPTPEQDEEEVAAEVEALEGMWDTPEVVDESGLVEAGGYGRRVKDPKTGRMAWVPE
ncbi:MAG: hypothetical protein ACYTFG_17440 [Planctomycetota bacterium]|jgi:hypothetical protein